MVGVGLIGLGAIGRLHFHCWQKSAAGRLVALSSRDPRKRAGEWPAGEFNLGDNTAEKVDLSGLAAYASAEELIADPAVQIVDICTATPLHAPLAIAALFAGKDVICEKPMALTLEECHAIERAQQESGRQLMVAHCLRYWPHYVRAAEIIHSGEYGAPLYARLERSSGAPFWSADGWLMKPESSGGIFDMHIHDIDVALWWFGHPASVTATGLVRDRLPLIIDTTWSYPSGATVQMHAAWDPHGGPFRHAFRLVLEKATLSYDLSTDPAALHLHQAGQLTKIDLPAADAHQAELDDFAACIADRQPFSRFTPAESRTSVDLALQAWRQLPTR